MMEKRKWSSTSVKDWVNKSSEEGKKERTDERCNMQYICRCQMHEMDGRNNKKMKREQNR